MKKLHVFLIHGTWAGAGRWTHHDSIFRIKLRESLKDKKYEPSFETFPWNGRNRSRAREKVVKAVQDHVDQTISEHNSQRDYLIVAHSHGGNIATDAVRNLLAKDPKLPIRGIVCLNTPFFTHEVRGSSAYLIVWFLIALALWIAFWRTGISDPASLVTAGFLSVPRLLLLWGLGSLTIIIVLLLLVSVIIRKRKENSDESSSWGPRPNVLCLSCPDDEAITLLGLGEGIANLPQLLLHPFALVLFATVGAVLLRAGGHFYWCGNDPDCWNWQLDTVAELFMIWVGFALLGGVLGAFAVTVMFGLPKRHALKTLVSRVLVSYMPLSPAQSFFRAINSLPLRRGNPLQLFHSAIYRSPQTIKAICHWLQRKE